MPLLAISLLIGMSLTIFLSPAIGIPLLALAALFGAIGFFGSRSTATGRMEEFREQAGADVEFSERDRQTLTPTESDPAR